MEDSRIVELYWERNERAISETADVYKRQVLVTELIISPPVRNGGISSSNSRRPYNTPIPMGPMSLWPENARKSAPSACTSTGIWGALWAASTTRTAPRSFAMAAIRAMGFSHPSTFDT